MQRGLHIGIASWIDAQYRASALPAFPAAAIPFKLCHFSTLSNPEDLARVEELALLSNRVPDADATFETDAPTAYLWDRHREIVGRMVSAVSRLTEAERSQLARADAILFKSDGFTPSDAYTLFIEARRNYDSLVEQNANPSDIEVAFVYWATIGQKSIIEEAIANKIRLSRSSSVVAAQADVTRIELALDSLGTEVPCAPTSFAPISAISTEYWNEAQVDLQALEDTIRPEVARDSWNEFRGRKIGSIRFRFVSVDLLRSWFNSSIYEADDWRLLTDELVASGDGREGELSTYFSRIYMAQIISVQTSAPAPPFTGITDVRLHGLSLPITVIQRRGLAPLKAADGATSKEVLTAQGVASQAALGMLKAPAAAHALGVVSQSAPRSVDHPVRLKNTVPLQIVSVLEARPHLKVGLEGRWSVIEKLDPEAAVARLNFAKDNLNIRPSPEPQPIDLTTYLVGFGRSNLPRCPNPNPNYLWP